MMTLFALLAAHTAAEAVSNVAYSDGNVRFTVISDGAVRMEYSPDGKFTDDKSFMAVNRDYPEADYKVKTGKWIEISTPKMKLRYRKGSGAFTRDNLSISSVNLSDRFTWRPGDVQTGNLKGTFRTLDGMDGDLCVGGLADCPRGEKIPLEDGLLARDGWTLIDDSESLLLDGNPEWEWVKERPSGDGQDWYFLAYGDDYKGALRDYALFAGKMPLPPRYAFGYWWSRYWMYSDHELRNLVKKFRAYDVPLDVLVIDMDWHYTDEGRGGWTGWTWNKELFPDYPRLLGDLNREGYQVTLNLHPADGVKSYEEKYADMAHTMGIDPATGQDIPWIGSDKKFVKGMFDNILTPMERAGVNFWWLDWQQHLFDPVVEKLKNTWWCSYIFFTHAEKFGDRRPLIYHRWSGLGNHRYQVGFSGDAVISWKSLDFQPYFNSTASNVLYGYWSHDIGGHMNGTIDPEMYVRWMQFGALSPVMRSHSTKDASLKKEPWVFDDEITGILHDVVRQRYRMAPYIYTMARKGYDEALSLCRPLYYDYPAQEEAYSMRNQYMFGDNMLVAPVTSPMTGGWSAQKIWLPEGEWFDMALGELISGGATVVRSYALDEYPVFVKAGSILPFYGDEVKNLKRNDEAIELNVFPGGSGEFTLYEDNGDDKEYASEFATTHIVNTLDGNRQTIVIEPRKGSYRGMPDTRTYRLRLNGVFAPERVVVNGREVACGYDGNDFAATVELPSADCSAPCRVEIVYPDADRAALDGMKGRSRRVAKALERLKSEDAGIVFKAPFALLGSICEAVSYDTASQPALVKQFNESYGRLSDLLRQQGLDEGKAARFLNVAVAE